jgi:hypothetical protein
VVATLADRRLETDRVELVLRFQDEPVSPVLGPQPPVLVPGRECRTQFRHLDLEGVDRVLRLAVLPQLVDEGVTVDDRSPGQQQPADDRAGDAARQSDGTAPVGQLQAAEQSQMQGIVVHVSAFNSGSESGNRGSEYVGDRTRRTPVTRKGHWYPLGTVAA